MEEQIVSCEIAELAKEKGFLDVECSHYYDEAKDLIKAMYYETDITNQAIINSDGYFSDKPLCVAPTQALLQKWLREVHKIDAQAYATASGYAAVIEKSYFTGDISGGTLINNLNYQGPSESGQWETYEKALEVGLQEALKIVK